MNNERQPLLTNSQELEHQHVLARPDLRNSPENVLIDVQNETNEGICYYISCKPHLFFKCIIFADMKDENESSFFNSSASYEPSMHRTLEHPTSNLDTMIHLLKGNVGTGN